MAEELANQEQETTGSQDATSNPNIPDFQALNQQAKNIIANIESGLNLPARPKAIDAYTNIAGNPLTGSNPGAKDPDNASAFINALDNSARLKAQQPVNQFKELAPFTYNGDYDAANFERYYSTGDLYNKLGFNPYRNNEALYNNNMTFGDQFARAAKQWDNLVGVGFMSGVKSWGTLFTDPLAPDIEGARAMEKSMAIGSSNTGGLGSFFTNTFLNSGYTVGIGGELLAENLALMGAGFAVKGAATALKVPSILEKGLGGFKNFGVAKDVTGTKKGIEALEGVNAIGNNFNEARSFWNTIGGGAKKVGTTTLDILNPLDNTIDALRSTDYATNYAKLVGTFGGFADDMLMMKAAVSEAKLEGGMSKLNITKDLTDEYRKINGKDPVGDDLAKIETIAAQKAHDVAFWNLPAIVTSNKLLYATMMAPLRKVMGRESTKLVDDYVFSNKSFSAVGDGVLSRTAAAAKSLAKPKYYGKFGINYLTANFAEGIQENIQDAISEGAANHALDLLRDPIRASYEGYMPYFLQGMKEQLSAKGAETFAGGFLMGAFAQPIMAAPSIGISKIIEATTNNSEEAKKLKDLKEEQKKKNAETLNELYARPLDYFAPDLQNAVRTGRLSDDMFAAAKAGDKLGTLNAKDAIQNHHIATALRTGKFDIIRQRLADYKNLNKDEIVEAFGKYGIAPEDVDKASSYMDGVLQRADQIKKDYEDVANTYSNPFNPSKFAVGSPERLSAEVAKAAWDEAAYNLVFAKATFISHSKRIADVANTFSNLSSTLAKGDANLLMSMLSSKSMTQEINMLRKEISTLDESLPEQKKIKADKQKQLEGLQDFYKSVENYKYAKTDTEKKIVETKSKEAFAKHLKNIASKNDVPVFNQELDTAFNLVKDHMLLKDEMAGLVNSINVLMTPESFFQVHKRLVSAYTEGMENLQDTIANNLNNHDFIKDLNDVLNDIKDLGFHIPDDVAKSYADAYNEGEELLPLVFLIDSAGNKVDSGEAFEKASQYWNTFINLTQKKENAEEALQYDQSNFLTYPSELKDLLINEYNNLSEEEKAAESLEEWATSNKNIANRKFFFEGRRENVEGIDDKYKAMDIPELNLEKEILEKQAETDPKLEPKVRALEDYIAYRVMMAVDMPEKQKQALRNMLAQAANTQNRGKENEKYVINDKKYDTRVTTVVYEILEKKYGLDPFKFSETDFGKTLLTDQKKMLEEAIAEGQNKNIIVNMWVDSVKNSEAYKQRWDDNKTLLLKESLKDNFKYEDFEKAVADLAYQESKTAGNTIDEVSRNFLSGTPLSKPTNMTQDAFDELRKALHNVISGVTKRGEIILAKDLVVTGDVIIDNEKQSIAGEMDLLVITPEGTLKIYDFKTARKKKWDNYGTSKDQFLAKEGYALQLSLYKRLIEEQTGLKVDSDNLKIVPFEIQVNNNGIINNVVLRTDEKNINHSYNPIVEEYVPVSEKLEEPFTDINKKPEETIQSEETLIVSNKPTTLTINDINNNINIDTLKEAKAQKLEVDYEGNRYKIRRVGKKTVTLNAPNKKDISVKESDLAKKIKVVEPGVKKATSNEKKQVEANDVIIATNAPKISKDSVTAAKNKFLESVC